MENNIIVNDVQEEEKTFSIMDFMSSCLSQWKWFLISIIVCVGLGTLYVIRQQPQWSRTMQVLIQDDESGGVQEISNAFKSFGLGGNNTNVNNELISLKSPAVMQEVVKRLNLTVNVFERELPHTNVLYGSSSPVNATYESYDQFGSATFLMDLNPDGSYELHEFKGVPAGSGKRQSYDVAPIKGRLGFDVVKTPVGAIVLAPNGGYTFKDKDPISLRISITSEHVAVESYLLKLKADLTDADADVIDLTITDQSVQRATDILNTIVEVYNEFWVRDKNRMAIATSEFIDERLKSLTQELAEVDSDIADYQSSHHMPDLEQTSKMYLEETSSVNKSLVEAENQLAMAKYTRDYVSNPANKEKVVPVLSGVGNTGLEQLVKDYNTLLLTREGLIKNSSPDNPLIDNYTIQVDGLRESLIASVKSYVGSLEANLRSLQAAQGANMNQLASAPTQAKYLGSVKRDQEIKEQLYLYLLQKREENQLSQAFNAYNTRIITPPFGSMMPVSPKTFSIIAVSFILGLMIPAVVIYFIKVCDTKVRSRKDLDNLPIPFIGEIPQIGSAKKLRKLFQSKKQKQKEIDTPKPIVGEGKRDVPNEAFRVVRSNIDLMLGRNAEHSIIMVTSFNPGSGKSFVAFNLGASFALKHKKVLLIDGDLRHGSLSGYVGSPTRGLASYLTGKTDDPQKIIYKADMDNLYVIPIGKRPPNPAELLEGPRFKELLDSVKDQFDIVMVDCPPVNVVVDTQLINRYAESTLFVVRAGLLERSAIKDLTILYNEKKLHRMSILLNGTEATHSSYYTYGNYQSLEE